VELFSLGIFKSREDNVGIPFLGSEGNHGNYSWMRCPRLITDSEDLRPCTDCCGTHRSDSPIRAL
jgi:hypothetical protein